MEKNITVLLVDDNTAMRTMMRHFLEHGGYKNIIEADEGSSAFKIVKSRKIDLIISDWNMLGMTGLEFVKKIREDSEVGETPFLMVTVEGMEISKETAFQGGVTDFLSKPFKIGAFLEKIDKIRGRSY